MKRLLPVMLEDFEVTRNPTKTETNAIHPLIFEKMGFQTRQLKSFVFPKIVHNIFRDKLLKRRFLELLFTYSTDEVSNARL